MKLEQNGTDQTEREGGNGMKLEQNGTDQNTHTERFTSERNGPRGREGGREGGRDGGKVFKNHCVHKRNGAERNKMD